MKKLGIFFLTLCVYILLFSLSFSGNVAYWSVGISSINGTSTASISVTGSNVTGNTVNFGDVPINTTPVMSDVVVTVNQPLISGAFPTDYTWGVSIQPGGDFRGLQELDCKMDDAGDKNFSVPINLQSTFPTNFNVAKWTSGTRAISITESIPSKTTAGADNVVNETGVISGSLTFIVTYQRKL